MEKAKVDTGMATIMEPHADVQHLQDFLANARKDYPLRTDPNILRKFKVVFESNADDQRFHEIFPEEELRDVLSKRGMSYKELRSHLIPSCARKMHDMLSRQMRSVNDMETSSPQHFAICRDLCQAAEKAMTSPL